MRRRPVRIIDSDEYAYESCYYCGEFAYTEKGIAFVREHTKDGWDDVPICDDCWYGEVDRPEEEQ
jgi:hypothetical protein